MPPATRAPAYTHRSGFAASPPITGGTRGIGQAMAHASPIPTGRSYPLSDAAGATDADQTILTLRMSDPDHPGAMIATKQGLSEALERVTGIEPA